MAERDSSEQKVSFKDTLNLPHTDFPIRANSKEEDPAMVVRWEKEKLFEKSFIHNKGNQKFILHDGPPYANGHIHIGSSYNKILKDFVTKSQRMFGKEVPVTPGWDCHGLPIESKVTKEKPNLSRQELIKACRDYAQHWIDIQRKEFKSLGVLMNWEHPFITMDFSYEADILRAFAQFVEQGYIERKNKTVPWCPFDKTVLAAAEIEYYDRKDPSIYVLFPLEQNATDKLFPNLKGKTVNLLVWTTTPWTLPLNRAVLLKPQANYVVLDINGTYALVGQMLADKICAMLGVEKKVVAEIVAEKIESIGPRAQHPFIENLTVPVILDQSVMLNEGTAFVHSAPGAGPQDYEVGVKNNLEIYSPVGPDGTFTDEVQPVELHGMSITDAQGWVIKKLQELNKLLYKTSIKHSYPHCWRCRNGLIFRATKQWFCNLEQNDLKQKTLKATNDIKTVPEKSINRLQATLEGRLEWVLSRQRAWGVPIPSVICTSCDYTYITPALVEKVAQEVEKRGIEAWDAMSIQDVLPKNFVCPQCKKTDFKKEYDILDVWFESGISHYAVLLKFPELEFPADMYLEGKDQHRAWFQSSLLTSMVLEGKPCMKIIMTHGFVVDAKGHKMSKSLGNIVAPQEIIDKMGTDGLRLWVSSIDLSGDPIVSEVLLKNVQEVFRKIRNTCRFLISNLYDFDIKKDAVPLDEMKVVDQYALQELFDVNYKVLKAYSEYDFTAVFHTLSDYCSVNLSAFYLDIVKDRLYVELAHGKERRSAQTACWYIVDTLTKLMAPILSFTAEQISDHYQKNKTESIHLQQFNHLQDIWNILAKSHAPSRHIEEHGYMAGMFKTMAAIEEQTYRAVIEQRSDIIKDLRSALLKAIEEQREKSIIKHSLEAQVHVYIDPQSSFFELLQECFKRLEARHETVESFFKELLIVSRFIIADQRLADMHESPLKGLWVQVTHASGEKCPRCWQWTETKHEHNLCDRCYKVIQEMGK